MDFNGMSFEQMQALSDLLDPANAAKGAAAFQRPASQKCGYSLSEAKPDRPAAANSSSSAESKPTGAPANPGLVPLPPALAHKQEAAKAGLPVPSMTREGRELAAMSADEKKRKATGNDIWTADEIDPSFGAGAGGDNAVSNIAVVAPPPSRPQQQQSQPNVAIAKKKADEVQQQQQQNVAAAVKATPSSVLGVPQRVAPEYTMVFKHQVTAEDRFLSMDFTRDGSAGTADAVILRIQMPEEQSARDVNLDVKEEELALRSPHYQLRVHLPMKVLTASAAAKWDKSKRVLEVTLKADLSKREFMLV